MRGNLPAKIDDRGRLKVPASFRSEILQTYGRDLFVTSVKGDSVRVYPLPVWVELEQRLKQVASMKPSRRRFLQRVNVYGAEAELDDQGRVLIHSKLRTSAEMVGEVDVLGQGDFLEVWNSERLNERLIRDPFTDDDENALSDLGV